MINDPKIKTFSHSKMINAFQSTKYLTLNNMTKAFISTLRGMQLAEITIRTL